MKYLGIYEKNQDIATKEKVEAKLSYDATSDTVMQGGADVTEKVAKSLDMYIAPSNIGAVAYTNQELTDEQKQQARTNIGVGDATKDAKGIVQIGDNLNIVNGVLSRDKDVFWMTINSSTTIDSWKLQYQEMLTAITAGRDVLLRATVTVASGATVDVICRLIDITNAGYKVFYGIYQDPRTAYRTWLIILASASRWNFQTPILDSSYYVEQALQRSTYVNQSDTSYTTLMARGEKLLDATTFDAVTDWSTQLVNGAIAWRYS